MSLALLGITAMLLKAVMNMLPSMVPELPSRAVTDLAAGAVSTAALIAIPVVFLAVPL